MSAFWPEKHGWYWLQGEVKKWVHLTLGLLLNAFGTTLTFLANSWVTFIMSPAGVDPASVFAGDACAAIHTAGKSAVHLPARTPGI